VIIDNWQLKQEMILLKYLNSILCLNCQQLILGFLKILCVVWNASILKGDFQQLSIMDTLVIPKVTTFAFQQEVGLQPSTRIVFFHSSYKYSSSLPCQLLGMLLKLMCSKWNRPSKWVTRRGRRSYLFPPQTNKVKRLLSLLLSHHVGLSWRKRTKNLKTSYKET
jgi:hypothetical protein